MNALAIALASDWAIVDDDDRLVAGYETALEAPRLPLICLHPEVAWLCAPRHGEALVVALTGILGIERERKQLAEEALAKYRELNLLFRIHEIIGLNSDAERLLQSLADETGRLVSNTGAIVYLADEGGMLRQAAGAASGMPSTVCRGEGPIGQAWERSQADIMEPRATTASEMPDFASLMVAPMRAANSEIGVLAVTSKLPAAFTANDLKLLVTLAAHGAIVLENARLCDRLRGALERAEAANRAKSAFLRNMGHELRTPLNVIIGFAEVLGSMTESANQRECTSTILKAGTHLLDMLNDILEISRGDEERDNLLSPFALPALLEASHSRYQGEAGKKGLALAMEVAPELPSELLGDEVRMGQILRHLYDNAIKFSQKGTITLQALLRERRGDSVQIQIAIQDQGIGISPENQARIFAGFEQGNGERNRQFGGVGLGLTACKYLLERMGGEMGVESVPGEGSRFWFRLWMAIPPVTQSLKQGH